MVKFKKMIGIIWGFLLKLIQSETNESSKRFLAVYGTLILMSWIVFVYTNESNSEYILAELIGFVLVLCGVASWERVNRSK